MQTHIFVNYTCCKSVSSTVHHHVASKYTHFRSATCWWKRRGPTGRLLMGKVLVSYSGCAASCAGIGTWSHRGWSLLVFRLLIKCKCAFSLHVGKNVEDMSTTGVVLAHLGIDFILSTCFGLRTSRVTAASSLVADHMNVCKCQQRNLISHFQMITAQTIETGIFQT